LLIFVEEIRSFYEKSDFVKKFSHFQYATAICSNLKAPDFLTEIAKKQQYFTNISKKP